MVGGAVAVRRAETTGLVDWEDTDFVSVSSKQRETAHQTDMPRVRLSVSNEVEDIFIRSLGDPAKEDIFLQGLAEDITAAGISKDLQNIKDIPEEIPKTVRSYQRNRSLAESVEWLSKFADSLGTAAAAMHINLAKKALASSWEAIAEEDTEIKVIIASLEGTLRQKKWQDYSPEQVGIITGILTDCIEGRIDDLDMALKRLSILRKKGIDIYPSASEEDYAEEEEEI